MRVTELDAGREGRCADRARGALCRRIFLCHSGRRECRNLQTRIARARRALLAQHPSKCVNFTRPRPPRPSRSTTPTQQTPTEAAAPGARPRPASPRAWCGWRRPQLRVPPPASPRSWAWCPGRTEALRAPAPPAPPRRTQPPPPTARAGYRRARPGARQPSGAVAGRRGGRRVSFEGRDETCPVSTGEGTRRVPAACWQTCSTPRPRRPARVATGSGPRRGGPGASCPISTG